MSDLRTKLIDIVWDDYPFDGNPYANDIEANARHDGRVAMCEKILEILDMSWDEVKVFKIAEIRKIFADKGEKMPDYMERHLAEY